MTEEEAIKRLKTLRQMVVVEQERSGQHGNMTTMYFADEVRECLVELHAQMHPHTMQRIGMMLRPTSLYQQSKGAAKVDTIARHSVISTIDAIIAEVGKDTA